MTPRFKPEHVGSSGPDGRNVHIQIVAVPGDGLLFKAVSKVVVEAVAVDASNSKGENGQYSKVPADGKTKANQGRGNSHDNNSMHVRTRLPGAARGDRRRAQKAAATKLKAIEAVATTFFFSQTTLEALWLVELLISWLRWHHFQNAAPIFLVFSMPNPVL